MQTFSPRRLEAELYVNTTAHTAGPVHDWNIKVFSILDVDQERESEPRVFVDLLHSALPVQT